MGQAFQTDDEAHDFLAQALAAQDAGIEEARLPSEADVLGASKPAAPKAPRDVDIDNLGSVLPERTLAKPAAPAVAPAASAPQPTPDDGLALAQGFANARRKAGLIGLAGHNFAEAFRAPGSHSGGTEFWDRYAAAGDEGVKQFKERRAFEEEGEKKRKAAALEADMANPASPQSEFARSLLAPYLDAGKLEGKSAKDIAASAPWVTKLLEGGIGQQKATAGAQAETARNAREKAEEQARYARGLGDQDKRAGQKFERDKELARIAAGAKATTQTNEGAKELEKRVPAEAASMLTKLDSLEGLIGPDGQDIPGMGAVARHLPNFMLSSEGQQVRQSAKGLLAQLMKMQSGTAASEGEVERKAEELGMGSTSTQEQFRNGLKNLRKEAAATIQQHYAGFTPESVKTYEAHGGVTPGAFAGPPPPGDTVRMVDPDGDVHDVPRGEVTEARRRGLKEAW